MPNDTAARAKERLELREQFDRELQRLDCGCGMSGCRNVERQCVSCELQSANVENERLTKGLREVADIFNGLLLGPKKIELLAEIHRLVDGMDAAGKVVGNLLDEDGENDDDRKTD